MSEKGEKIGNEFVVTMERLGFAFYDRPFIYKNIHAMSDDKIIDFVWSTGAVVGMIDVMAWVKRQEPWYRKWRS